MKHLPIPGVSIAAEEAGSRLSLLGSGNLTRGRHPKQEYVRHTRFSAPKAYFQTVTITPATPDFHFSSTETFLENSWKTGEFNGMEVRSQLFCGP